MKKSVAELKKLDKLHEKS